MMTERGNDDRAGWGGGGVMTERGNDDRAGE